MDGFHNANVDKGEKTWLTPRWILDPLGHFDTDPCSADNMPWSTADRMITKEEDGLATEWRGRVWLNPPYGREGTPFMKKMAHYAIGGGTGIALLFARTDTSQWQDWIFPFCKGVMFLRRRVGFCLRDGTVQPPSPAPSALVAYSDFDLEVLERAKIDGKLKGSIMKGFTL